MSWLFSQALVEEYLGASSLDGAPSAPLNGKPIQQAYCAPDKMTDFSRLSRFGMTYKPLTESRGEELLTLFREDFLARTSAPQEKAQESMEKDQECGEKWHASFVKYDHNLSLWRTHQCSLLGDLEEFLETWPQWGLMRDGECWEQRMLEQSIKGTEFGLLEKIPTPTASDHKRTPMKKSYADRPKTLGVPDDLAKWAVRKSGLDHARLEPVLWEWAMGWPEGWTDLKPLVMDKSHYVQQQHGES
jgi:hypothetical protein